MGGDQSLLRRNGGLRRVAPFAAAATAGFLTVPLAPAQLDAPVLLGGAAGLTALIIAAALLAPWERLPRRAQALPPLAYFAVVALLREAEGGGISGFSILLLLPVFWMALYGTRGELIVTVIAAGATLAAPILLVGDPAYPASEWRRTILFLVVGPIVGFSVQRLMAEVRARAAELAAERSRLGTILENLDDGVVACDRQGHVTLANRSMRELHDLDPELPEPGRWGEALGLLDPRDRTPLAADEMPMARALRGESVRGREILVPTPDGHERHLVASGQPIRDDSSSVGGAVVVVHDVTEAKRAERLKDEFLALVSHELRTPLTPILGYLELLLEDEPDAERAAMLGKVERSARRLQRLVGDLLFIAQLEAGELPLEAGSVDLAAVATEAVEALEHRARRASIDLNLQLEPLGELSGDADRMGQVLDNLIANALKYTPEFGRVDVRVLARDGHALLEVADTGIGIAAEEQDQVFERFFRASSATDRVIPGVGLGLAVVQAIVAGHGGSIELESEEGAGTTFRVRLPLEASSSTTEAAVTVA